MNCCSPIQTDTGRLFTWLASLQHRKFRLFGFEKTQRQLLDGIQLAGHEGAELLEIGCGTGDLHQFLLQSGAAGATGVDLARGMLAEAQKTAEAKGFEHRTDYRLGDFVQLSDELPDADITILDKVVCCYPDWQALIDRSLEHTRRVFALTYPRDRLVTRVGVRCMNWGLHRIGCCYQPYIHDPQQIQQRILGHGFRNSYTALTMTWYTQIYTRI